MTHTAPGPPLLTKDGGPGHFGITVCQSKEQSCACGRIMLIGNKKPCVQWECWGSIPIYSHPGVSQMKELLTDKQILEKAMKKAEFFKKHNVRNAVKSTPDKSPTEYPHSVDPAKNEDKSPVAFSTSTVGTDRQNLNRSPIVICLQQESFLPSNKNMNYLNKDPGHCVQFSLEEDKGAPLLDAGKAENMCTLQGDCSTDGKTELQQPSDESTDAHPVDAFEISRVLSVKEARIFYDCVKNAKRPVVLESINHPHYERISDYENPVDTNVILKVTEAQSYSHTDILEKNGTLDSQSDPCFSAKFPQQYAGPGPRSNEQALLNIKATVPSISTGKTENCSPEQLCRCPVLVETEVGFEEQLCTNCKIKRDFPADKSTQIMDLTTDAIDDDDYDDDDWLVFPVVISDLRIEPRGEIQVTAEVGVTAHNFKDTMSDESARTSPSFEIDSEKDSIPQIGNISSSCDTDASCDEPASSVDNCLTTSILCVDKEIRLENKGTDVKLRTLSGSADDTPACKIQKPNLSLDSHMTYMQVPQSKLQDISKMETRIKAVRQVQKRESFVINNLRERTGISPTKKTPDTVPVSETCRNDKNIQPAMEPERTSVLNKHWNRKESKPERLQPSIQNSLNSSDCDQALTSTIYKQRNDVPEASKVHNKLHQKNTAKKAQLMVLTQSDLKELRKQIPLSKAIPGETNVVGQKALVKSASITSHHSKQGSTSKRKLPLSSADGSHLATPSQKRGSPFLSNHSFQLGEQSFQQEESLSPRESLSNCDGSNFSDGHVSQCREDSASSSKYASAPFKSVTRTNSVWQQVHKNWSDSFVPTPNISRKKKVQFEISSHRSRKKTAKEHCTGKKSVNEPSRQRYNSKASQMMKETKRQATEWRKATHRNRDAPYNQKNAVGEEYDVDEGYEGRSDKGKRLTPKGICREQMRRYFKSI